MSNKYKILELLKGNKLTVKEIADKSEFNENTVRTYIHRLLKEKSIREIGKKNRYCLYEVIEENDPIELLKQLYNIMTNKMTKKAKAKLTADEMKYLTEIEEVLKID